MGITYGPRLELLINADIGEDYTDAFRPFLRAIDALVQPAVISSTQLTPPAQPQNGDAYLLIGSPTGVWAGQSNNIAMWSTEICVPGTNVKIPGWEFFTPNAGWLIFDVSQSCYWVFNAGSWSKLQTGGGGTGPTLTSIPFTSVYPGPFSVTHNLGVIPKAVSIEVTAPGFIYFQNSRYDNQQVYLVASDANLTGVLKIWT